MKTLFKENIYTDLALESREALTGDINGEVPGVASQEEIIPEGKITRVTILDERGEALMGKSKGTYITIESPGLKEKNRDLQTKISQILAREIATLSNLQPDDVVLIVGLGNWNATPDALGPRVVNKLLITRHLNEYAPQDVKGKLRSVCAIAPGVLGITGIETGEIVKGVVEKIKPKLVIAVDALAARSADRISTTVQLANTGIHPGSGVGNKRIGITQETVGVPVIAVGVPTVVHALTIAQDTIVSTFDNLDTVNEQNFGQTFQNLNDNTKKTVVQKALETLPAELIVTPREIDDLINDISRLIAGGINAALHPGIDYDDINMYIH